MFRKSKLIFLGLLLLSFKSMAQEKVYFGQTEIGFLVGNSEEQWDGRRFDASFMTFHGAHITKNNIVGFSLGIDQYNEISVIPITLGWRGFLGKDGKPRIFGGLDIGAGSTILEKKVSDEWSKSWYEGGTLISPSAGISFPSKKEKTALSLTMAYKRQQVSHYWGNLMQPGSQVIANDKLPPGFNSLTENNFLFRSFVFRAGLIF